MIDPFTQVIFTDNISLLNLRPLQLLVHMYGHQVEQQQREGPWVNAKLIPSLQQEVLVVLQ